MTTFNYSGQDDEEMRRHDGAIVSIVRRLGPKEVDEFDVGPMYHIRFPEGCQHDAFIDELDPQP